LSEAIATDKEPVTGTVGLVGVEVPQGNPVVELYAAPGKQPAVGVEGVEGVEANKELAFALEIEPQ
jgi:hypothetical protein